MPSNFTENYELSQWEPTDPVLRRDFNADNLKLDGALHTLDTSLSALTTSLSGKLGRSEIIETKTRGTTGAGHTLNFPSLNWDEWEYVCMLVSYSDETSKKISIDFSLWGNDWKFGTVRTDPAPGFLMVLLPRHNGSNPTAGFVISNQLIPFSLSFPYKELIDVSFGPANKTYIPRPGYSIFGGK